MTYRLKLQAALRRHNNSQSESQIQNSISQVGAGGDRLTPVAEIGRFQQFNAESGKYVFSAVTQSVQISPDKMLSNGRLGVGQKVLLAQGTADFIPV